MKVFFTFILILLLSSNAHAIFIIDTGTPIVTGPPSSGGTVLNINQSLASEFTLDQDYAITDIEGFIGGEVAGSADISIYNDGGLIPGSDVFSSDVFLALNDSWQGLSGLGLNLGAGTYWVGFELRSLNDNFVGRMLNNAPFPLGNEAFTTHGYIPLGLQGGSEWIENDGLNIGVRIQGNVIPEPATILLFGSGLLGAFLRRKRIIPHSK